MKKKKYTLMLLVLLTAIASRIGTVHAASACDRECLKQITDKYFDAMAAHSTAGLPLSPALKFTQNGHQMKLGEGFWKTAGKPTYRMDLFDPETGGAGVEAVVMENGKPVIMMLRLKIADGKISEVETIICREGDDSHWGPDKLVTPSAHWTRPIRPAEQNSRFEIMAAADAYFRAFETEGTPEYARAPFLPDTNRFENGVQTTNVPRNGKAPRTPAEQFDIAQFKNARIYDRRYPVVDVEHGTVLSIIRFGRKLNADGSEVPMLTEDGKPRATPDSPLVAELFAVSGGKIREIQAILIRHPNDGPTGW